VPSADDLSIFYSFYRAAWNVSAD